MKIRKYSIKFLNCCIIPMEWMLDIQLGRHNLSPIQRIAVAEKYRPIYEKQAKEAQSKAGIEFGNGGTKLTVNLPQASQEGKPRNPTTDKKLSEIAGVSEKTYRMGAKVLNSDNEDIKERVLSGETSISAGYKELIQKKSINISPKLDTSFSNHPFWMTYKEQ